MDGPVCHSCIHNVLQIYLLVCVHFICKGERTKAERQRDALCPLVHSQLPSEAKPGTGEGRGQEVSLGFLRAWQILCWLAGCALTGSGSRNKGTTWCRYSSMGCALPN